MRSAVLPLLSAKAARAVKAVFSADIHAEDNTNPVAPGRGAAIFLHLDVPSRPGTGGGAGVSREDMIALLRLPDSGRGPYIVVLDLEDSEGR